jgi:hypothetical protein
MIQILICKRQKKDNFLKIQVKIFYITDKNTFNFGDSNTRIFKLHSIIGFVKL